jgi:hypothetical protein
MTMAATRRINRPSRDPAKACVESKLYVVALAFALARRWPQVLSNAVDSEVEHPLPI